MTATAATIARPRRTLGRRLLGALGVLLLLVIMVPTADVIVHRFVPPPATFLALERTFQGQGYQRHWRPLAKISPNLVYAVVAAEDEKFCSHYGFDWDGISRAMRYNATHKTRLRGGSTISQQTAKNVFLWPGRGFVRKGFEAYYTVLIETLWGKRRIMEVYLNMAEWAPGVYGAQAAAQYWFHTDADKLSPSQAARLAAILPRPLKWKAAAPGRFVRGRSRRIAPEEGEVRSQNLAGCVFRTH
jgi:monofunctional biosynthetic peptidoglycan transglycosylase